MVIIDFIHNRTICVSRDKLISIVGGQENVYISSYAIIEPAVDFDTLSRVLVVVKMDVKAMEDLAEADRAENTETEAEG